LQSIAAKTIDIGAQTGANANRKDAFGNVLTEREADRHVGDCEGWGGGCSFDQRAAGLKPER
jgi:hypothetical protein